MKNILINNFGNHWKTKVLNYLINNYLFDFTKKDIIKEIHISRYNINKYFNYLTDLGLIYKSKNYYRLNLKSPITKSLMELDLTLIGIKYNQKSPNFN